MRMKKNRLLWSLFLTAAVILSACGRSGTQPTATAMASPTEILSAIVQETPTLTPEPTQTPTPLPTDTPVPTATATLIPFKGFADNFRFYRSWYDGGKTIYYFLNAWLEQPLWAKIGEFSLKCAHDPDTQSAMKCISDERIELPDTEPLPIEFFADEGMKQSVFVYEIVLPEALKPVYSNQFDCPERGQNVQCEIEYRLYADYCSTSITCYDACGYYYSIDNLPPDPDAPWTPVGSCS